MNLGDALRRMGLVAAPQSRGLFLEGDRFRDNREWTSAAERYSAGLKISPEAFGMWVQLGHVLKESGDLAAAGAAYVKALELAPLNPDLHVQLGHYYKVTSQPRLSIRHYRLAIELGSTDFEAFKGGIAGFGHDVTAWLGHAASDSNRTLVARTRGDVDAIFFIFLGRRPSSESERQKYYGMSFLGAVSSLIASEEFGSAVLERTLNVATLPHRHLGHAEWWLALELLPAAGFLTGGANASDEVLCGSAFERLTDAQFVEALYWELLWREPDDQGRSLNIGKLARGAPRRQIVDEFQSSAEFALLGRGLHIDWGDAPDPFEVRLAANVRLLDILGEAVRPNVLEPDAGKSLLAALAAGTLSRREVAESTLSRFGSDWLTQLGGAPHRVDWRSLLHSLFTQAPLARVLRRVRGRVADQFIDRLAVPLHKVRLFKNGALNADRQSLLKLPETLEDVRLDRHATELYGQLVNLLLDREPVG